MGGMSPYTLRKLARRGEEVGKGDPNENFPNTSGGGGEGVVVCGRESRPHDG